MTADLNSLFDQWPHDRDDESENVRCVQGDDGKPKIQVRVRCGVFQWEYEGRPDGARPYGCTSLLDYYEARIRELREAEGSDASLHMTKEEVEAVGEELLDYYQRRVLFFKLGEYDRARQDAEHNLALMDIIRANVDDPDVVLLHERWRPFVLMHRTEAVALLDCQNGNAKRALRRIDEGVRTIRRYFKRCGRDDLIKDSQELAALGELKQQLRELYELPLNPNEVLAALHEEQEKAIADEDYERAARLRDEITRFQQGEGLGQHRVPTGGPGGHS
jgi:tetratricopeptide (TPR) repeat protein